MAYRRFHSIYFLALSVMVSCLPAGCSKKSVPYDENLLKNPSFEEFDGDVPKGWKLGNFRGLEGEKEVEYGMSAEAYEGDKSFYFKGERDTRRWLVLTQEVKVSGITHVRIKGAIRLLDIVRTQRQYSKCGFFLILLDKNRNRFQETRFADIFTQTEVGTKDWYVEDKVYRIPSKTEYIVFGCILGMKGTVWFDDVSLMVPEPLPWKKKSTKNFDFYSMPEKDFPKGANSSQQDLFDEYCKLLNTDTDLRISYYYYPDSTTMTELMSMNKTMFINWDDKEIHTIKPIINHEIIHFITDEYGRPPRAIAEGGAFFLMNRLSGKQVHAAAKELLFRNQMPRFADMLDYGKLVKLNMGDVAAVMSSFVGYLYDVWGPDRLLDLTREASGSNTYATFSKAFEKVYRVPLDKVIDRWKVYLTKVRVESGPVESPGTE